MNFTILISALLLNIGSNMLISFSDYLRLMKENPLKVSFMFGKVIPSIYEKIPLNPLAIKYNLISHIFLYGTPLVDFYFNSWWSAIIVFSAGRIIGQLITRLSIGNITYYNKLLKFNLITAITFIILVIYEFSK